ncbi:MAG: cupin domain-containing protein [Proteobacteria bacterium]|nr:cupin domain-containing protein [Pseudomonadota bacterium]
MAKKPVINISDLKYFDFGDGGKFEAKLGPVSPRIGADKLGYNVTLVKPGKRAFPYHLHHTNEEMFFIIEGEGTLRYNDQEYPIKKGDFIACPAGPGTARQIINTSKKDIKYLALSTTQGPEVAEYPDSNKVMVHCGPPPMSGEEPHLRLMVRKGKNLDYFDGESD